MENESQKACEKTTSDSQQIPGEVSMRAWRQRNMTWVPEEKGPLLCKDSKVANTAPCGYVGNRKGT